MRALFVCLLLTATAVSAKEKWGVKMPDTTEAGGKTLKLNGMGLRTKFIVRVYVGGLYVENTSKDASKILGADEVRRAELKMLRNLEKEKVSEAISAGFEKNSKAAMPALKERLDKLVASLTELKEGQLLIITYVPGQGTTVKGPTAEVTLPGKDFGDALFSVWLGKEPVDEGLKSGMLGND